MKNKLINRIGYITMLTVLAFLLPFEVTAQVRVTKITDPDLVAGRKGIFYNLPRTRIQAELWITKTQQFAGPLAEFAGEYLGIDDVIVKNSTVFSIGKASISTFTESDPGQLYLVENEEKSSGEIWISFGNSTPVLKLEKFDKTIRPESFASWNEFLFVVPEPAHLFRKYSESLSRDVIDTIIRKVSIDTLVFEKKIFKHSMVEYSDREKAQEASLKIKQIEQDKYNLLIGYQETAYSRETLEFMFNELENQKLEYLKLFTGVSVLETLKFDYQVFPEAGQEEQNYIISGFLKSSGMITPDGQNDITVTFKTDANNNKSNELFENQSATGFVYRVPRLVHAVLSFQEKELASRWIEVLQLGSVQALPPEFKRIEFDMETGALKSVVLE